MADDGWKYYAAIAASGVSTVAWFGTVAALVAARYHAATGGPAMDYAEWTIIALGVAIGAARLEKRLYRVERGE